MYKLFILYTHKFSAGNHKLKTSPGGCVDNEFTTPHTKIVQLPHNFRLFPLILWTSTPLSFFSKLTLPQF